MKNVHDGHKGILYHSIRKYGEDNFSFDVIEECEDHLSNEREIFWINSYDSFENGFNLTTGGDHFSHSEITKNKIGDAFRGKSLTEESKQKMRDAWVKKRDEKKSSDST